MKQNCWEFKGCGREPRGEKSDELGVCPAAIEQKVHGLHDGINGGRTCWAVSGTLCGGQVQGSFASKLGNCLECDFYTKVRSEEASKFITSKEILTILQSKEAA